MLQLHTRYRQSGGEDAVATAEARRLRRAGHEVITYQAVNPEGAAALPPLSGAVWNNRQRKAVGDLIRTSRPTVVHLHNWWFAMSPAVVFSVRDSGIPLVVTLHNYRLSCLNATHVRDGRVCDLCLGRGVAAGVRYRCYRQSAVSSALLATTLSLHREVGTWRHVDRFIALSQAQADVLGQTGLSDEQIVVKPNAVDDPGPRTARPSTSPQVLFVGRVAPEKGLHVLLDAWRRVPAPMELLVVGDGPERRALQSRSDPRVRWLGAQPATEVRRLMRAARVLVTPHVWWEPFGLVTVEAMAAGLPVVTSDLGAPPETAGPGGWTFPAGDPDALSELLRITVESPEEVDRRGRAGRSRWRARFHADDDARRLTDVYDSVLSRPPTQ